MRLEYFSDVKDGKLQKGVSVKIAEELKHFEGKRVHIRIERLSPQRSLRQNKTWYMYMSMLGKELGYSKDEMHQIAGYKLLKRESVHEGTGEVLPYIESTTKLTRSEFAELITNLVQWSAECLDIVLPLPNEQFKI